MELIIHLGVHKTASTFFQKKYFNKLAGYEYVDRNLLVEFKNYLLYEDDFNFNPQDAYNLFLRVLRDKNSNYIISDEDFYCLPFNSASDKKRNLNRLIEVFEDKMNIKIIILLREQTKLLNSLYLQYVKTGGVANASQFIKSLNKGTLLNKNYFFFDSYINYIESKIGKDNLKCMFFEHFLEDTKSFLHEITKFILGYNLSVPLNKVQKANFSINYRFIGIMLLLNKVTKTYKNPFGLFCFGFSRLYTKIIIEVSKKIKKNKMIVSFDRDFNSLIVDSNKNLQIYKEPRWLTKNKYIL